MSVTSHRVILVALLCLFLAVSPAIPAAAGQVHQIFEPVGMVRLHVHTVRAIEQTTDWFWSPDEIFFGGTALSLYGVDQIPYQDLGAFEDDTTKRYGAYLWTEIPVTGQTDHVRVLFSLVEHDSGDMDKHLDELTRAEYEEVRRELMVQFRRLLDGAPAAANAQPQLLGAPAFGRLVGAALKVAGEVALGIILLELWEWLIGLTGDDAFEPQPIVLTAEELATVLEEGELDGTVRLADHNALYEVGYTWSWVEEPVQQTRSADYRPTYSLATEMAELWRLWRETNIVEKLYLPAISK